MKKIILLILFVNTMFSQNDLTNNKSYANFINVKEKNDFIVKDIYDITKINNWGDTNFTRLFLIKNFNSFVGFTVIVGFGLDNYTYFYTDTIVESGIPKYIKKTDEAHGFKYTDLEIVPTINTTDFYLVNNKDTLRLETELNTKIIEDDTKYLCSMFDVFTNKIDKLNLLLKKENTKIIVLINNKLCFESNINL